jgi:hypothetical protein
LRRHRGDTRYDCPPIGGAAADPRLARRVLYATAEESMEHIGIGVSRVHTVVVVRRIATDAAQPRSALAFGGDGRLWVVDRGNTAIRAVTLP